MGFLLLSLPHQTHSCESVLGGTQRQSSCEDRKIPPRAPPPCQAQGILGDKTSPVAIWEGDARKLRFYKGRGQWAGESGSGLFSFMGSIGAIKIEAEVGVRLVLCASHRALCCCGLGEDLRRQEEEKGDKEREGGGRRQREERRKREGEI